MKKIVIIGATSGIGKTLAELYAKTEAKIAIVGRREDKLREIAVTYKDKCSYKVCDIMDTNILTDTLNEIYSILRGIDIMIVTAGTGELNPDLSYELEEPTLKTNVLGWTCVVDWTMKQFERQGFGHLVSISSVGGLRGSGIAPAYNATKAFQINYLEGMRQKANKLSNKIFVTDIRPGFVDTAMAKGDSLFWVAPVEQIGTQIYKSIEKKRSVVYVTKRWRYVALLLKILPSFIYNRM